MAGGDPKMAKPPGLVRVLGTTTHDMWGDTLGTL
jgi:hypothetical protein